MKKLMTVNPRQRLTIKEALDHCWFKVARPGEDTCAICIHGIVLRVYMLSCPVLTPPPMVWSPLALARGLGPGLRLGKTTSQPSSLYLLHVA